MARTRSSTMTGDQLDSFLERRGLSRGEFATALNEALDRRYNDESVRRWVKGDRPIPKDVATFVEALQLEGGITGPREEPDPYAPQAAAQPHEDSAPGPGPSGPTIAAQSPLGADGGMYARACEDLWEMVATGLGMMGAATGSEALQYDCQIILADKAALGAAYGRLAASNDTFRKMLVGMTEGGAWLQVALVTGTTVSKCWQAHAHVAQEARTRRAADQVVHEATAATAAAAYNPEDDGHAPGTPGAGGY